MTMNESSMNRSWTVAAMATGAGAVMLALGIFLAVGKDTLAGDPVKGGDSGDDQVKVVRVITGDDADGVTIMSGAGEDTAQRGGYLGVSVREDTKSNEGGAFVENVVDGSPADKAGLKDGDVIVGFGGDVIRGPGRLTEKLRATKAGEKVAMDVRRDGKPVKLHVEMGERPKTSVWTFNGGSGDGYAFSLEQQKALEESLKSLDKIPQFQGDMGGKLGKMKIFGPGSHRFYFSGGKPLLGVELVETTPDLREALGGSKDAGVLVGKVLPGSAAEKAGLRVGDLILSVDGVKVADSGDLIESIHDKEGKTVDIDLTRDKKTIHMKAVLPKLDEEDDPPTGPRASRWAVPSQLGRFAKIVARLAV
jgi:membrane-associated protease RseP (regulator of RpoE activity)